MARLFDLNETVLEMDANTQLSLRAVPACIAFSDVYVRDILGSAYTRDLTPYIHGYCGYCGTPLLPHDSFCGYCGIPTENANNYIEVIAQ